MRRSWIQQRIMNLIMAFTGLIDSLVGILTLGILFPSLSYKTIFLFTQKDWLRGRNALKEGK